MLRCGRWKKDTESETPATSSDDGAARRLSHRPYSGSPILLPLSNPKFEPQHLALMSPSKKRATSSDSHVQFAKKPKVFSFLLCCPPFCLVFQNLLCNCLQLQVPERQLVNVQARRPNEPLWRMDWYFIFVVLLQF
jgi:hypothetical protein